MKVFLLTLEVSCSLPRRDRVTEEKRDGERGCEGVREGERG